MNAYNIKLRQGQSEWVGLRDMRRTANNDKKEHVVKSLGSIHNRMLTEPVLRTCLSTLSFLRLAPVLLFLFFSLSIVPHLFIYFFSRLTWSCKLTMSNSGVSYLFQKSTSALLILVSTTPRVLISLAISCAPANLVTLVNSVILILTTVRMNHVLTMAHVKTLSTTTPAHAHSVTEVLTAKRI